jgi:hypothetical protein
MELRTDPETCKVSFQNKFEKLVRLVGFITKKFFTMHGHMNVKKMRNVSYYNISANAPFPQQVQFLLTRI